MRAAEKIIEGLTTLMEGFVELQEKVEAEFESENPRGESDTEDPDVRVEIDAAVVTEIRATLEAVMDAEDYSADEFATFISVAQDALEEIDPDVFEEVEESEEAEDDEEVYYGEEEDEDGEYDFDYDEDEDLGDEDDDEEEEEEYEDEEDEDDDD
ncbi:MAG: hypothetical protein KDD70_15380 [Bdellovibrionales bacterium]|nr:hypothetical protein [Bdellovibrionales bacterium]